MAWPPSFVVSLRRFASGPSALPGGLSPRSRAAGVSQLCGRSGNSTGAVGFGGGQPLAAFSFSRVVGASLHGFSLGPRRGRGEWRCLWHRSKGLQFGALFGKVHRTVFAVGTRRDLSAQYPRVEERPAGALFERVSADAAHASASFSCAQPAGGGARPFSIRGAGGTEKRIDDHGALRDGVRSRNRHAFRFSRSARVVGQSADVERGCSAFAKRRGSADALRPAKRWSGVARPISSRRGRGCRASTGR